MIATLAMLLLLAAPAVPAPDTTPPSLPNYSPIPEYVSEVPRAGLKAEMFERPTKPEANLVSLFSTDDYPLESIHNAEQGTVGVVLRVSPSGQISDCIVERSSGYPALDSQTCRIMWLRARFRPAHDSIGRPVESAVRQRIRWELPEDDPKPVRPWSIRLTVEFIEDGGVVGCKFEATGAIDAEGDDCRFWMAFADKPLATLRAEAGYPHRKLIIDVSLSRSPAVPDRNTPDGAELIARQVARLTIDESGKPLQCRVIDHEGPLGTRDCSDLLKNQYEKPGIKTGAIEVTVARSTYFSQ